MITKKHIKTKKTLAAKLDVSRPTLNKFLSQSGAPTRGSDGWDLEKVASFIGESASHESTAAKSSPKLKNLRCKEISLRCERLAFRIAVEKRQFVSSAAACEAISRITAAMKLLLRQKLELEYPAAVAGLDAVQCRVFGKRLVDDILSKMQQLGDHLENL